MSIAQVATVAAAASLVFLIAGGFSSTDTDTWTRDGACVINIHDHNRWLWVDDSTTVDTYCKADGS